MNFIFGIFYRNVHLFYGSATDCTVFYLVEKLQNNLNCSKIHHKLQKKYF